MSTELDLEVFNRLLKQHLGPGAQCRSATRATAGNSQETWLLDIDGVPGTDSLVLRRSAPDGTLAWSDRVAEAHALQMAAVQGLPVPRVRWFEADGNDLGLAYVVMDHSPGGPPRLSNPQVCDRLAEDLGYRLAQLHSAGYTDTEVSGLELAARQLEEWTARARRSSVTPPLEAALLGWLRANVPRDDDRPVMVWGDPGPHNVLTDPEGTITAMLDWELSRPDHRLSDLGAARWSCLGHLDRELLTTAYERHSGHEVDRSVLRWFEVLACLTTSIMLSSGVDAVISGRVDNPNVAALGVGLVTANLLRAANLAWGVTAGAADDGEVRPTAGDSGLRPTPGERVQLVANFLRSEVIGAVDDQRVRRQLKIAASLLDSSHPVSNDDSASRDIGNDTWHWYDLEASGQSDERTRRSLVAPMWRERRHQQTLLALYGSTLSLGEFDP